VVSRHDLAALRVTSEHPLPFQVDGDFLGERTALTCTAVPNALRVVC
jgi:diacylglycerol kinase family enzyme